MGTTRDCLATEIHGFSDASARAYAAAVYIRVMYSLEDVRVVLLTAKSKVAPLKMVSVPRLELNGASLSVKLLTFVQTSLALDNVPIYGWTDSTVVLTWVNHHPSRWKPFVANRVSLIQTALPRMRWSHVPSADNPADCASRGISTSELQQHLLWWQGPSWLSQPSAFWPSSKCERSNVASDKYDPGSVDLEERREIVCVRLTCISRCQ